MLILADANVASHQSNSSAAGSVNGNTPSVTSQAIPPRAKKISSYTVKSRVFDDLQRTATSVRPRVERAQSAKRRNQSTNAGVRRLSNEGKISLNPSIITLSTVPTD